MCHNGLSWFRYSKVQLRKVCDNYVRRIKFCLNKCFEKQKITLKHIASNRRRNISQ